MSVYYKFKSARDYDSIPIDGHFISVANLKERIFESKRLGNGTDFDLMVSNAQTNEEYADEATLIPKNTSVLIRRVPGRPRKPIVTQEEELKPIQDKFEEMPQQGGILQLGDASTVKFPESDWDDFGNDLYAIAEILPTQSLNPLGDVGPIPTSFVDEESKLKALIDTPALDWQRQGQENFGPGRGYGRGIGGRMIAGRGFGRGGGLERKTPPQGYICHRCKVPGHFIQHCPTNGDPNFDIRRVKPPTGIPKSMLMATPDGSYALPSGAVAVLKPNEAAFEREIEGMPSTRPATDFPPELRCPLCKEVMKDAVLTSKCCFSSFCDKCIRDHIISKTMCVCGFTNIFADDLLPNKTLRETISRMMESTTTSSAENAGSLMQVQDMESARPLPAKVPSPSHSANREEPVFAHPSPTKIPTPTRHSGTKGELAVTRLEHPQKIEDASENEGKEDIGILASMDKTLKHTDISEATPGSVNLKATSQESSPVIGEDIQEKVLPGGEQGKKKKKKKARVPGGASETQWRGYQESGLENFGLMPIPPAYNQYTGMPWGMDGYMAPFPAAPVPFLPYHQGPFDVPFGGVMLPQDPFASQGYMMPIPPQRDLSELSRGFNTNMISPMMSREEHEARKAGMRRREPDRHNERTQSSSRERERERESARGLGRNTEKSSLRPKPKVVSQGTNALEQSGRGKSPARSSRDGELVLHASSPPPRPSSKRKFDLEEEGTVVDQKLKGSVFSRISFPGSGKEETTTSKKLKTLDPPPPPPPNGIKEQHHESSKHRREERRPSAKSSSAGGQRSNSGYDRHHHDHESSGDEYHFKRRPSSSRNEGGGGEWEEDDRPSRSLREKERGREHDHERRR